MAIHGSISGHPYEIKVAVTDEFKKMVADKVEDAKNEIENNINTKIETHLAEIAKELRQLNWTLALMAERLRPNGQELRKTIQSVALDGTVREAEVSQPQWDGRPSS